jgi:uncharacterized protein (DUF1015 family)
VAEIKPFRGLRYNLDRVGAANIREVVCPPYDVIGREAQHRYLERNRYNIVRLELGETFPEDNFSNNRYTRAAAILQNWELDGLLLREERPTFYLYEQDFRLFGIAYRRQSLITALRLEDYSRNIIIPHEKTLNPLLADRLALLEAINTNLSPIFCLYEDPAGQIAYFCNSALEMPPLYQFTDEWGDLHRLYAIQDSINTRVLEKAFAGKRLYIADGHHRYQTALDYRAERHRAGDVLGGPADYILAGLTAFEDPGLLMIPLHRVLNGLEPEKLAELENSLPHFFGMEEVSLAGEADPAGFAAELVRRANEPDGSDPMAEANHVIGMYRRDYDGKATFTLLKLKSEEIASEFMPPRSPAWQRLEVSQLHALIFDTCLGLSDESYKLQSLLDYTRDEHEAFARVDREAAQMAFLLPPTRLSDLRAVADSQEQMPPKSTYFYPKFMTGLVMRPLD